MPPHPIPLPGGERGRVRGNYLEFLNKYAENPFAMVRNEPEHLLNELLRHDTSYYSYTSDLILAIPNS